MLCAVVLYCELKSGRCPNFGGVVGRGACQDFRYLVLDTSRDCRNI